MAARANTTARTDTAARANTTAWRPPAPDDTRFTTISRLDEDVFIGGYLAAADPRVVRDARITHVLKLFPDDATYYGGRPRHPGVTYKVVDASDVPEYPLDRHFAECLGFIQEAIRGGGRILVHCHAGVSRSATICLLHLMVNRGHRLDAAWERLKAARPVVNPNPGFRAMLADVDRRAARFRAGGAPPRALKK